MADIQLHNITKSYDKTPILKGVDLTIREGEFIALVGASGCGKSTLLRIIAGLEQQTTGQVTIANDDISELKPRQRDLAMVFQSYALYPHLTVQENMLVPLKMAKPFYYRLPGAAKASATVKEWLAEINTRVEHVAEQLQITALLDRKPAQLSGGQRQRVALGRAMVRKPKAFLMDEPLSNLDAKLRVHMRTELSQLHRQLGSTFIYVTHDQIEAMTMADRIALVVEGQLLQVASPDEMYNNPCHLKVAEFIGSPKINILPATLTQQGVTIGQHTLAFTLGDAWQDINNTAISLGIRPEHLILSDIESNHSLPVTITHTENTGCEGYVYLTADWLTQASRQNTQIVVKCCPERTRQLSIGQNLHVQIAQEKVLAFSESGERISPFCSNVFTMNTGVNYG
ncbi:ABC transporter ATP-binding protein [Photobacterium minamisatsumaniensis]|uniref:ABC transporter ATP-binding protein n=1 Tax=Photobacterium minamisatsumaniensis TaxID=2910233 RepID=UPI003D0C8643